MPQETKSMPPETPEEAAAHAALPGWTTDLADERTAHDVLEKAFDYRGDVTLRLADGREIMGYLFDRRRGKSLADSCVRLLAPGSDDKITVSYAQIKRVSFSDRDPAAGKSFETWIRKYVEKKLAGEKASIESDPLD